MESGWLHCNDVQNAFKWWFVNYCFGTGIKSMHTKALISAGVCVCAPFFGVRCPIRLRMQILCGQLAALLNLRFGYNETESAFVEVSMYSYALGVMITKPFSSFFLYSLFLSPTKKALSFCQHLFTCNSTCLSNCILAILSLSIFGFCVSTFRHIVLELYWCCCCCCCVPCVTIDR